MKKRPYQEPTTEVIKLDPPPGLLAGTNGNLEPLPPLHETGNYYWSSSENGGDCVCFVPRRDGGAIFDTILKGSYRWVRACLAF